VRAPCDVHRIDSTSTALRSNARASTSRVGIEPEGSREKAMKHTRNAFLAGTVTLALAACSAGDEPSTSNTDRNFSGASAEGAYGGALTGSPFSNFIMVILDDTTFWEAYGRPLVGPLAESGFVEGTGTSTSTSGTFTSSDARDFGLVPTAPATITATYTNTGAAAISGSIVYDSATVTFSGTSPISGTTYLYTTPALLSTILGNWTLTSNDGITTPVTIAATGTLDATDAAGCSFTGSVSPRASGKNVYNVSLTFGAAPCAVPGATMNGIALALPLAGGQTELMLMAIDSSRTNGYGATGTR
jgi:hypothetical protein